ncbi:hypothetical protein G6F57_017030 [Rhizopus arrhizus]|nr:hypothetical protein G6F57_017030 [Rhizopus arrhizus]
MSRRGKNADLAAPTRELAAAMARSAAAMSGRRSSSVDGRPAGIDSATFWMGCGGIVKSDGARPSSTASACSVVARRRSMPSASDCAEASSALARARSSSLMSPAS